jgi:hypothetical protein
MDGKREALIVATGSYSDIGLRRLRAPAQDAGPLAKVLEDPAIGGFAVQQLLDQPAHVLARAVERFFANRGLGDRLLVHLSCHGVKDDDGRLYFAASDTERHLLASTALSARFLNDLIDRCRAQAIILLLDCCYSGAFMAGSKGDQAVHLKDEFPGRGRAILTASSAIEYAWEGDELLGSGQPSLFTAAIVEGLETGEADIDRDGVVSVDDLYKHVYQSVRQAKRGQTPLLSAVDVEPDLYVARNPRSAGLRLTALPVDVRRRVGHPLASERAGVVVHLARLLHGGDPRVEAASRQALVGLSGDDSQIVSASARAALGVNAPAPPPVAPALLPAEPASTVHLAQSVGLRQQAPPIGDVGEARAGLIRSVESALDRWSRTVLASARLPSGRLQRSLAIGAIALGAASGLYWLVFALVATPASGNDPGALFTAVVGAAGVAMAVAVLLRPGAAALGLLAVGLGMRAYLEQAMSLVLGYHERDLLSMLITNPGAMRIGVLVPLTPLACLVAGLLATVVWLHPRTLPSGPAPAAESALDRRLRRALAGARLPAGLPQRTLTVGAIGLGVMSVLCCLALATLNYSPFPVVPAGAIGVAGLAASLGVLQRPAAGAVALLVVGLTQLGIIEWVASTTYLAHEAYLLSSLLTRPGDMGMAVFVPLTPVAFLVAAALAAAAWLSGRTGGRPPAGRLQHAQTAAAIGIGALSGLYWLVFAFVAPAPQDGPVTFTAVVGTAGVAASLAILLKPGAAALGLLAVGLVMRGSLEQAMGLALGYNEPNLLGMLIEHPGAMRVGVLIPLTPAACLVAALVAATVWLRSHAAASR